MDLELFPDNNYFNIQHLMDHFLMYKKINNIGDLTYKDYIWEFKWFKRYLISDVIVYNDLKTTMLKYLNARKSKSPVTYNKSIRYMSCFFNYLVDENVIPKNPITDLRIKKRKEESKARNINIDFIEKFIDIIDEKLFCGFRDKTLIYLLLDCGIRPSEALKLTTDLFLPDENKIIVTAEISKTKICRDLFISNQTVGLIKKLIYYNIYNNKIIFPTIDGQLMKPAAFGKRLIDYSKKSGVKITSYQLRHSFAIYFLRNGGNIFALQKILGHTTLEMTKKYIHLADSDLQREHQKATPLQNLSMRKRRKHKLILKSNY